MTSQQHDAPPTPGTVEHIRATYAAFKYAVETNDTPKAQVYAAIQYADATQRFLAKKGITL